MLKWQELERGKHNAWTFPWLQLHVWKVCTKREKNLWKEWGFINLLVSTRTCEAKNTGSGFGSGHENLNKQLARRFQCHQQNSWGLSSATDLFESPLLFTLIKSLSRHSPETQAQYFTCLASKQLLERLWIVYNYSPKGRWIVVDIYRDAKRRRIYPPLFTDPEGDSCFSIYQIRWKKMLF